MNPNKPHRFSRIVVTCGVSLFSPNNTFRQLLEEEKQLVFPSKDTNPQPPKGVSNEQALEQLKKWVSQGVKRMSMPDPSRVSAEYSAIHSLNQQEWLCQKPQVILIHTDTFGGTAAAQIVEALLEKNFSARVECKEVRINVEDRDELRYNLGNFMREVAQQLHDHDRHTTCFAPLGGYKVMTSLGYLAGALFGYPTIYLHEEKQIVHEVPAVPIKLSREDLQAIAPLMKRIKEAYDFHALNDQERLQVDQYPWLFERTDDEVGLNAFGIFLMEWPEYADLFAPRIRVSEEVNKEYSSSGEKAFIEQQLKTLAGKLAAGSTEADLRHESTWDSVDLGECHLYKGASNGPLIFRAIYTYKDDTLAVYKVWTNHDKYEREFKTTRRQDLPPATIELK